MDRSDPTAVAQWIRSEKVNAFFGVPTLLQDLARSDEVAPEDLASLSDVWTGGTFLPARTRTEFETRFGRRPHATYGLSEVPTIATMEDRGEAPCDGSSGRALPHLVVEVGDDDGSVLPAGQVGTITVRAADSGPWAGLYSPMLGYLGMEEATSDALRDDTLVTGDVGFLDNSGRLFVTDRRNALILRGGANVYPAEVERVLLLVPGVRGAAVVGVADARLGAAGCGGRRTRPRRSDRRSDVGRVLCWRAGPLQGPGALGLRRAAPQRHGQDRQGQDRSVVPLTLNGSRLSAGSDRRR